jgi:hypothetical protein
LQGAGSRSAMETDPKDDIRMAIFRFGGRYLTDLKAGCDQAGRSRYRMLGKAVSASCEPGDGMNEGIA